MRQFQFLLAMQIFDGNGSRRDSPNRPAFQKITNMGWNDLTIRSL